jgi:hypothetical protein
MITSLSVAVRIWAKSVSITILILSISLLFNGEIWEMVLFVGLALIFGFFITSPLLIIISPLVEWSSMMPYANRSKMTWLIFFLSVLYLLIVIGFCSIVQGNFNGMFSKEVALFFLSIIVVEFIAVRTTRKRLYTLYEQNTWPQD